MRYRYVTSTLGAVVACVALAACGSDDSSSDTGKSAAAPAATSSSSSTSADSGKLIQSDSANAGKSITLGTKNFTEAQVVAEVYAQALEAAGYKVKRQFTLGSEQIAFKALKAGRIDAYPEYTGTALTSFFKVATADVPTDSQKAYEQAKAEYAKIGITALPPTPFTDSNGFAITPAKQKELGGATKLSDLTSKASSLTIAGPPECRQRTDCYLGLQKVYDQKYKKFTSLAIPKIIPALKAGQIDVGEVFTTDGRIKADKLVLLQDDKKLFPPYNETLTARDQVVQSAGPAMAKTIETVQQGLTTEVMQELNSRVDIDKESAAAAASEYLKSAGYTK